MISLLLTNVSRCVTDIDKVVNSNKLKKIYGKNEFNVLYISLINTISIKHFTIWVDTMMDLVFVFKMFSIIAISSSMPIPHGLVFKLCWKT